MQAPSTSLRRLAAFGALTLAVAGCAAAAVPTSVGAQGASVVDYWQAGASVPVPVAGAVVVGLQDGDVLVAGGEQSLGGTTAVVSNAELYDPATGTWAATGALTTAVYDASAVLLGNGDVLVAGGENLASGSLAPINTAELYNPATGTWSNASALPTAEFGASLTLLANGKVLEAGGEAVVSGVTTTLGTAAVYTFNGWWNATTTTLVDAESGGPATLLANGEVLVAGGESISSGDVSTLSALQLYDPASGSQGSWSLLSATLPTAATGSTASLLESGQVLLAGGESISGGDLVPLTAAAVFDPASASVTATGSLSTARFDAGATLLADGDVLVAGGTGSSGGALVPLASSEVYDSGSGSWSSVGAFGEAASSPTIVTYPGAAPLVLGGTETAGAPVAEVQTFLPGTAPSIVTPSAVDFNAGAEASFTVSASGAPSPALTLSGTLPAGVGFSDLGGGTAVLAGTPASGSVGVYPVTITASNATGLSSSQAFTLTVRDPPQQAPATSQPSASGSQPTSATGTPASSTGPPPPTGRSASAEPAVDGYWLASSSGSVAARGTTPVVQPSQHSGVVAIAATPGGSGYWLVTATGHVVAAGDARTYPPRTAAARPTGVVGIVATRDGRGYWLVTSRAEVYAYGDAHRYKRAARHAPPLPAVGIAATAAGNGYLVASEDGAVTAYGSARAPAMPRSLGHVVGIAADPSGGYWLATRNGRVVNIAGAPFDGSLARTHLASHIVAIAAQPDGGGYYLLSARGRVFGFGDAVGFGSARLSRSSGAVGIALAGAG